MKHHERWMRLALKEAKKAFESGEVPVGCVIVRANTVIGKGYNQREQLKDPTAHAEIIAITAAANFLNVWRLEKCTLYVTKEPCAMCAGAILNARVEKIIFGCYDEKEGCCGSLYNICADPRFSHKCAVRGGVLEDACQTIIVSFFKSKR